MGMKITIPTRSGTVTATCPDERALQWDVVYPWGVRQSLYGEPTVVEAFLDRRVQNRDRDSSSL